MKKTIILVLSIVLALSSILVFANDKTTPNFQQGLRSKINLTEEELAELKETHLSKLKEIINEKVENGEISQQEADEFFELRDDRVQSNHGPMFRNKQQGQNNQPGKNRNSNLRGRFGRMQNRSGEGPFCGNCPIIAE